MSISILVTGIIGTDSYSGTVWPVSPLKLFSVILMDCHIKNGIAGIADLIAVIFW
jgi:hypothetical protein